MDDNARTDYMARHMGFVFQLNNLLPVLSTVENVELPMLISGTKSSEARQKAMEVLEMVGLVDRAAHKPVELSGGQRQRVTIARAGQRPCDYLGGRADRRPRQRNRAGHHGLDPARFRQNNETFIIVTHAQEIGDQANRTMKDEGRVYR